MVDWPHNVIQDSGQINRFPVFVHRISIDLQMKAQRKTSTLNFGSSVVAFRSFLYSIFKLIEVLCDASKAFKNDNFLIHPSLYTNKYKASYIELKRSYF